MSDSTEIVVKNVPAVLFRGPGPLDTKSWLRLSIVKYCAGLVEWAISMLNSDDSPRYSPSTRAGQAWQRHRRYLEKQANELVGRMGSFAAFGDDFDFNVLYKVSFSLNKLRDAEILREKRAYMKSAISYIEDSSESREKRLSANIKTFKEVMAADKEVRWGFLSETYESYERDVTEAEGLFLDVLDLNINRKGWGPPYPSPLLTPRNSPAEDLTSDRRARKLPRKRDE